ncbi:MAG TPA: hypothetical protein C5S51_06695 [Methanosarcinaceae archaeon]|nr:hypothetical protein [Methanosarcinaceae archaeon]
MLPHNKDYVEGVLPVNQILAIQNYKSFKGYISNMFVSISNITALLTVLTAFKVGRLDLIRSPSAFRSLSI